MLPQATLARLRELRKQKSDIDRGMRDLVDHEEGLERFLAQNGLEGFLNESPKRKNASLSVDDDSPSKRTRSQVKSSDERRVTFGPDYTTAILPNGADEEEQEPDLATARAVVASQYEGSARGRRGAALPGEMPTIQGNTITLPLGGGVVTATSELVAAPSARSEKLRARRGTGLNLTGGIKRTDAFLK